MTASAANFNALFADEIEILPARDRSVAIRLLTSTCHIHHVVADIIEQTAYFDARGLDILDQGCDKRRIAAVSIKRRFPVLCSEHNQGAGIRLDFCQPA